MTVRGNSTAFNAVEFAKRLKQVLDTETTTPATTKQVKALANLDAGKQAAVLSAFDGLVSKSELADYKEALEKIGAQINANMAFLSLNKLMEGGAVAGKAQHNTSELRKIEGSKRKPSVAPTSTEPLMDGVEKLADSTKTINAAARANSSPQAKSKIEKFATRIEKEMPKLIAQAGNTGMDASKVDRDIAKLRTMGPEGVAKADLLETKKRELLLDFASKLEAAANKNVAAPTVTATVGAAPAPTAALSAAAIAPAAQATAGKVITSNVDFAKANAEQRSISRSQRILDLINSGASIEYILMAVMMLFFEDSDDQLKEKLSQQMAKQKEVETLRNEQTALENNEPAALKKLGVPELVAPIVQPVVKAVKLNELEKAEDKLQTEIAKTDAEIAATPVATPAIDTPIERAVAATAEAASKALDEADKKAGPQAPTSSEQAKTDTKKKVDAGEASGGAVAASPKAIAEKQQKDARVAATAGSDAKVDGKAADAQTPAADTQTPTAPDAPPAPSKEELRQKRLNEIANELRNRSDSGSQVQMEVQQLMERRTNMVELVSKLLSQISQMLASITRNI